MLLQNRELSDTNSRKIADLSDGSMESEQNRGTTERKNGVRSGFLVLLFLAIVGGLFYFGLWYAAYLR